MPDAYVCESLLQPLAQLNGPTSADTVLVEPPTFVTVSVYVGTNVAVIVRSALMVTAHVNALSSHDSEPVPDQPVKREPEAAAAVSVTTTLFSNVLLQLLGEVQAMPSGEEFSVPLPDPANAVVRVRELNVAET